MHHFLSPWMLLILCCAGVAALSGCSRTIPGMHVDKPEARQLLDDVMQTWKKGSLPTYLKARNIRLVDDDYVSGSQLLDYAWVQNSRYYELKLELRNKQGKRYSSLARYHVILTPSIAILRGE
jgi:hypothetical protein